jgi:prepilin-type processing-associated H-X9-DG protein/prepilin-type N-terminal cleavage/methylation domain-containing protein
MSKLTLGNDRFRRSARAGVAAFTLLELLVVLTVVAILASLLSSALNKTKSKTRQIICLNNLRQLQVSWFLYPQENDDVLPLNKTMPSFNERIFGRRNTPDSWVAGNPKEDVTPENLIAGSLFPYTRSTAIYHCPADQSTVIGKPVLRNRSYSMSAYMNGDGAPSDPKVKTTYSSIASPAPDRVFVFLEEHETSAWEGSFAVISKEKFSLASSSWVSTPSDRHNQGCNLSFADGHVEYWKWYWPKSVNLNNQYFVNENELRDLRRLQESVPKQ